MPRRSAGGSCPDWAPQQPQRRRARPAELQRQGLAPQTARLTASKRKRWIPGVDAKAVAVECFWRRHRPQLRWQQKKTPRSRAGRKHGWRMGQLPRRIWQDCQRHPLADAEAGDAQKHPAKTAAAEPRPARLVTVVATTAPGAVPAAADDAGRRARLGPSQLPPRTRRQALHL
jgi:hypothetical protein